MNLAVWKSLFATLPAAALAFGIWAAEAAGDTAAVKALYEKAKAEGEVVVWGPQAREVEWIQDALAKEYPGIKVSWNADLRAGTKIIAEARAGRHSVDVIVFSLGGLIPMQSRDLLVKGEFEIFGTGKESQFFGGSVGAIHNLIYSVVYNTDKVKATDLPKTWEGFLDPTWKGKLLASPFLLPRLAGFLAMEWGEQRTANWLRRLLNEQDVMVTTAPREGILKSAERVVSITDFAGLAQVYKRIGVPADWATMEIIPAVQFGAAPFKNAPHPNAAKFVAGWLTTPSAKGAHEAHTFSGDVRPGSTSAIAKRINAAGGKIIFEDPSNMKQRADFYQTLSPIVTGAKK